MAVLEYVLAASAVLLLGWAETAMAAVLRTVRHRLPALGRGDPYDLQADAGRGAPCKTTTSVPSAII
jgi:hypothetical protein